MAKKGKQHDAVYRVVDVVGVSATSWEDAGRRAVEIIERLRTMLRRGEVALQAVDVNESLQDLQRLMRNNLIERGVSLSSLAEDGLPAARTDRVQLQQVLLNLVVNACDAMAANPPGDRNLTLTARVEQGHVQLGVLDCGVGLPEDVESLFQPCQFLLPAHKKPLIFNRGETEKQTIDLRQFPL